MLCVVRAHRFPVAKMRKRIGRRKKSMTMRWEDCVIVYKARGQGTITMTANEFASFSYFCAEFGDCWPVRQHELSISCACVRRSFITYLPFHAYTQSSTNRPFLCVFDSQRVWYDTCTVHEYAFPASTHTHTLDGAARAHRQQRRKKKLYLFHHLSILNYLLTSAHERYIYFSIDSPVCRFGIPARGAAAWEKERKRERGSKQLQKAKDENKTKIRRPKCAPELHMWKRRWWWRRQYKYIEHSAIRHRQQSAYHNSHRDNVFGLVLWCHGLKGAMVCRVVHKRANEQTNKRNVSFSVHTQLSLVHNIYLDPYYYSMNSRWNT